MRSGDSLPGFDPSVASVALGRLMSKWIALMKALPEGVTSTSDTDRLVLAIVLLAHENGPLVRGTCLAELGECQKISRSGSYAALDEVPWLLVRGYLEGGISHRAATSQVERLLSHHNSNIREWFHYVAWSIRTDLDKKEVRPRLLQNIADKLGAVMESAGLLAVLYPDKVLLDSAANAFEPEEYGEQYRDRLRQIREMEWNSQAFNFWLAENTSRKLIWDAVKGVEVSGVGGQ